MKFFYICCIFLLVGPVNGFSAILFQDDFEGYTDSPEKHGWVVSSALSTPTNEGYNNSRCVKITYTVSGTSPYWFGWEGLGNLNRSAIHVRFYFKTAPDQGGMKFCKLFGKQDGVGYANTTVPLESYGGLIYGIRYGDGSGTDNDTQSLIYLGPHNPQATDTNVVVNQHDVSNFIPDNQWHCFEFYMKYNSDGQRDGEYKIWIDGELRLYATNIKNRNDANTRAFDSAHFANFTATNTIEPRYIWYDNLVIADEYIGPLGASQPLPANEAPAQVQGFEEVQ